MTEKLEQFKQFSNVTFDVAKSYLIKFSENLEYDNNKALKSHELCKYINHLYNMIIKSIEKIKQVDFADIENSEKSNALYILGKQNTKHSLKILIYFQYKFKQCVEPDFISTFDKKIDQLKDQINEQINI